MSGESAANTLWTVGKKRVLANLDNANQEEIAAAEAKFKRPILEQYQRECDPYFATARLWDDGILDPAQTRTALALAFSITANAPMPKTSYGTFRM